jgi:elongator complex protein 3
MELTDRQTRWKQQKTITPEKLAQARIVLDEIINGADPMEALRGNPIPGGNVLSKAALVAAYNEMTARGELSPDKSLLQRIRMKPVRTLSGVTTVTVLTKPYPCPGQCIF